jgi:hypothetical protein
MKERNPLTERKRKKKEGRKEGRKEEKKASLVPTFQPPQSK